MRLSLLMRGRGEGGGNVNFFTEVDIPYQILQGHLIRMAENKPTHSSRKRRTNTKRNPIKQPP